MTHDDVRREREDVNLVRGENRWITWDKLIAAAAYSRAISKGEREGSMDTIMREQERRDEENRAVT